MQQAAAQNFTSPEVLQKAAERLAPHLDEPLRLFMADPALLADTKATLELLGFRRIEAITVKTSYFAAMRQLLSELFKGEGVILVNHPAGWVRSVTGWRNELLFSDFYGGVASLLDDGRQKAAERLSRCLPVFEAPAELAVREKIIEELLPFGIGGAFILSPAAGNPETRARELTYYLLEYFLQGPDKLFGRQDLTVARELASRRARAQALFQEVALLKKDRQYDKAIALCRQITEVLPDDPEGYLEGGRLLVKRKKYPAALSMFREAEAVASDLPTPNQEIALLRLAQVRDYQAKCAQLGTAPDPEMVRRYLDEAAASFRQATEKAARITAVDREEGELRKAKALSDIAEQILSQDLADLAGEEQPGVLTMLGLARRCLEQGGEGEVVAMASRLIPLALKAFHDGDVDRAERDLHRAAADPAAFQNACAKLNHLGTRLRRGGRFGRAVVLYQRLLDLNPPSRGVILVNAAIALLSGLAAPKTKDRPQGLDRAEAFGWLVEALMEEPSLPGDDNFYMSTILAPVFRRGWELFQNLARGAEPGGKAAQALEELLSQGQEGRALAGLLDLASNQPAAFDPALLKATPALAGFAARLAPRLAGEAHPRLRELGGLLQKALTQDEGEARASEPPRQLRGALAALAKGRRNQAAALVAAQLWREPELAAALAGQGPLAANATAVAAILAKVDMCRFAAYMEQAA